MDNQRSAAVFAGIPGAYPRAIYRSVGYTDQELARPMIGVVSSYNEAHPGRYQRGYGRFQKAKDLPEKNFSNLNEVPVVVLAFVE